MADDDTLLASLAPRFAGGIEDAATDALAYVLNKSAECRDKLAGLVGDSAFELAPLVHCVAQVAPQGTGRLDLVAYDESGALRLIIESKFWAPLLDGQASSYVEYLDDQQPAVLLFVAPEMRHVSLWSKIIQQFEESDDKHLGSVHDRTGIRVVEVLESQKRVAMTSWGTLLDLLEQSDTATSDDVRQLKGLARAQDDRAFLPLVAEDLSVSIPRRMLDFNRIVDDVVEAFGVRQGWMTTDGLKATAQHDGYLRYFQFRSVIGDRVSKAFALYVSCDQWLKSGVTQLWLRIWHDDERDALKRQNQVNYRQDPGGPGWIPLTLPIGAEYADVLEDVVAQVERVREIVLSARGQS